MDAWEDSFQCQEFFAMVFDLPDSPSTITVSPFHGTVDICPQSSSASIHEMNTFSANFQISTKNLFRGISCFIPSSPEVGLASTP